MVDMVDPDQMLHSATSNLGLYCLLTMFEPVCHSLWGTYSIPVHTVELQWLKHLWDRGNLFEIWVVRATEG